MTALATIELCPAAAPVATLVVLHGLGADGTDFIPMCDALDLASVGPVPALPRVICWAPQVRAAVWTSIG